MRLFFGKIDRNGVEIDSDDQQHILRVLRMRDQDEIFVTDGMGRLVRGKIKIGEKQVFFTSLEEEYRSNPFSSHLHIAIAPTKNIARTEFFIEKATEAGVSEISFLLTDRSERKNINIHKLRKQALASCKQSIRLHFPKLNDLQRLPDFLKSIGSKKIHVAHCYSHLKRESLASIGLEDHMIFLVGPEGDFSPSEIETFEEREASMISIGNQRLRTETAGILIGSWFYLKSI